VPWWKHPIFGQPHHNIKWEFVDPNKDFWGFTSSLFHLGLPRDTPWYGVWLHGVISGSKMPGCGMAISRPDALKRLNGLAPRVEIHLNKIAGSPASQDVPHWTGEINNWIRQMEEVLPHVGKRTAADWAVRIAEWKARLGQ
jgi:hypothetical protein